MRHLRNCLRLWDMCLTFPIYLWNKFRNCLYKNKKPPERSIPPYRDRFSRRYHPCSYMQGMSSFRSSTPRRMQEYTQTCPATSATRSGCSGKHSHIYTQFALNAGATLYFDCQKALAQSSEAGSGTRHRRSLSIESPLCKARLFRTIPLPRISLHCTVPPPLRAGHPEQLR